MLDTYSIHIPCLPCIPTYKEKSWKLWSRREKHQVQVPRSLNKRILGKCPSHPQPLFPAGFHGIRFIFGLWHTCVVTFGRRALPSNNPRGECITAHGWRKWCGGGVIGITLEWFCVVTVVTRRDDPKTTVDRGRHSIFFRSWNLEYHEIETNQQSNNLLCAT